MRHLAASLVCFIGFAVSGFAAQEVSGDFIVWKDRALTWDDFQGQPAIDSPPYQGAESNLGISLQFSCTGGVPDLQLRAEFDRSRSWARPGMDASLLEHEQIHFDIVELYVRKTRQEFTNLSDPCENPSAVRDLSESNNGLSWRLQEAYDAETFHGTRSGPQADWTRRIRLLLRASGVTD